MYHYVRPIANSRHPQIRGLELADFEGQLDYIVRHYNVVSVADVVGAFKGAGELPDAPLVLTFDDGYSDHFRYVLPVLRRRKLMGAFFPPACAVIERKILDVNKIHYILACEANHSLLTSYIENSVNLAREEFELSSIAEYREKLRKPFRFDSAETIYIKRMLQKELPDELRKRITSALFRKHVTGDEAAFAEEIYMSESNLRVMLSEGMEVGSHGNAHYWLESLNAEKQAEDIGRSLAMLERIGLKRDGFYFCYPYGSYNSQTLGVLGEMGCAAAFTSKVALVRLESSKLLELPRLDTNDFPKNGSNALASWTRDLRGIQSI